MMRLRVPRPAIPPLSRAADGSQLPSIGLPLLLVGLFTCLVSVRAARSLGQGRNKSFFFVAYLEDRFRQPGGSVTLITPTAAGRARLRALFPQGTNFNVDTYLAATENAVATVNDRPAISLDNQNLPAAQQTRGQIEIGSFFRTFSSTFTSKQFQLRTDHRVTENDQLSFRFISDKQLQPGGGVVGFEGFDADFTANYYNFLISETHVFSSTVTNELRLAYNRIDLGFPIADASGPAGTLPQLIITGVSCNRCRGDLPAGAGREQLSNSRHAHKNLRRPYVPRRHRLPPPDFHANRAS